MAKYNIEYNNKWACFSSISSSFITKFMEKEEYENWYFDNNNNPISPLTSNKVLLEAIFEISLNRTHEEGLLTFLNCGLPKQECEELYVQMKEEYYSPIHINHKWYECPNCGTLIEIDTEKCPEKSCEMEFYWE